MPLQHIKRSIILNTLKKRRKKKKKKKKREREREKEKLCVCICSYYKKLYFLLCIYSPSKTNQGLIIQWQNIQTSLWNRLFYCTHAKHIGWNIESKLFIQRKRHITSLFAIWQCLLIYPFDSSVFYYEIDTTNLHLDLFMHRQTKDRW
jgi:hypothetical protein